MSVVDRFSHDVLLAPREAARMLGVSTLTLARWAREGRVPATKTPFGHRRYWLGDITRLNAADGIPTDSPDVNPLVRDAVRLYEQGWSIRRVAAEFDLSYAKTRRILTRNTTVRGQ